MKNSSLHQLYWDQRTKNISKTNSKHEALKSTALLINTLSRQNSITNILDVGCGNSSMLLELKKLTSKTINRIYYTGLDYNQNLISSNLIHYPSFNFIHQDICKIHPTIENNQSYDIILAVNILHEVFSNVLNQKNSINRLTIFDGKKRVNTAITNISRLLKPGGHLVIFDGIESSRYTESISVTFKNTSCFLDFRNFVISYEPFQIKYTITSRVNNLVTIQLNYFDFTRYITKSIFFHSKLWEIEKKESYQYYTFNDFSESLRNNDLYIEHCSYFTPSRAIWESQVIIETPNIDFPMEHINLVTSKRRYPN